MASREVDIREITPAYLWDELHVKQGKTKEASELAARALDHLDTQDFSYQLIAHRYVEMARIAEVTSASAAKKSSSFAEAKPYLLRALTTVRNDYPVALTPENANVRGNYWQAAQAGESIQRIAANDMIELYKMVSALMGNKDIYGLAAGLNGMLEVKPEEMNEERFDLIRSMKNLYLDYGTARKAYEKFRTSYGIGSAVQDLDQIVTVSALMLGRAKSEFDLKTISHAADDLKSIAFGDPTMVKFVLSEIKKNIFPAFKELALQYKLLRWSDKAEHDGDLRHILAILSVLTHFGLGNSETADLKKTAA